MTRHDKVHLTFRLKHPPSNPFPIRAVWRSGRAPDRCSFLFQLQRGFDPLQTTNTSTQHTQQYTLTAYKTTYSTNNHNSTNQNNHPSRKRSGQSTRNHPWMRDRRDTLASGTSRARFHGSQNTRQRWRREQDWKWSSGCGSGFQKQRSHRPPDVFLKSFR
jgi:hypothetical protein